MESMRVELSCSVQLPGSNINSRAGKNEVFAGDNHSVKCFRSETNTLTLKMPKILTRFYLAEVKG